MTLLARCAMGMVWMGAFIVTCLLMAFLMPFTAFFQKN